ncbi:ESPR-type extended signal peptide-containing protein [Stenotrophomonas maltophilia]|uniref:ESPR-type extended signal peptide-containing protein n=1 Tax=Stenotrophomonas maltophilia TaxID=40324 RepID=UPI00289385DA|nr:ESPR-type extended signal peptide-containing protein [Stenotrophomonas maltophilia]MDT3500365.1 ESPR-type extended signal peptide-containing protein [Stenotrophomonas maltophilia]
MNRIYRLIWNTRLRCWAVASEHTRSRGKPSSAARPLAAALCVLLAGPALANDTQVDPPAGPESTVEGEAVWNHPEALMRAFSAPDASMRGAGLTSYQNVLIGGGSTSNSTKGVAIGVGSFTAFDGVGIGNNAKAYAGGVALGIGASTSMAGGGTALGKNARSDALGGAGAVVIGHNSYIATTGNTAVAIGASARVDGSNGTAVGASAQAGSANAIAVGSGAQASGVRALALGNNAQAQAQGSIVIGDGSKLANANAHHAIVIGSGARSGGYDAGIAIGQNAVTDGHGKAVALGANANAGHTNAVALGAGSVTGANNQVSVGNDTLKRRIVNVADGTLSSTSSDVVTGKQLHATNQSISSAVTTANAAKTTADQAATKAGQALARLDGSRTTIGAGAAAAGTNSTAIGNAADAAGGYSNAVGHGASSSGSNAVAMGTLASASGSSAIALGNRARTEGGNNGVAIGNAALGYNNDAVALGNDARSGVNAAGERVTTYNGGVAVGTGSRSGNGAVASGLRASATGDRAVAIGNDATADMTHATALGHQAAATANQATALGRGSAASARFATAVGNLAEAKAESSTALGERASASHAGSVALGNSSTTHGDNQVSVGSATVKRRIVNVADGVLSSTSTDAVTGKQLHATNQNVTAVTQATAAAQADATRALTALAGTATAVGKGAAAGGNAVAVGHSAKAEGSHSNAFGYQASAAGANAVGAGTLAGAAADSSVALGNRAAVDATSSGAIALGTNAKVNAQAGNSVALGAGSVATGTNQVSVGGDTVKRRIVNVADGTLSANSADAVTGKQLHATNQNLATVNALANTAHSIANDAQAKANVLGGLLSQSAGNSDVRLGAGNSGGAVDMRNQSNANRRVTGVADAALSTTSAEAVSGRQLHATNQNVTQVTATAATLSGLVGQAAAGGDLRLGAQNSGTVLDVRNQGNVSRRISGVADGVLSAASTDAVSGRQLNTTNQNVTTATTLANTAHTVANAAQSIANDAQFKANVLGGLLSQASSSGDVRLGAANSGGVLDVRNQGNQARRVQGVAAGQLSATSDDAVSGRQLFDSNAQIARNRTDIDRLREDFQDFDPDLSDVVRFNADGNVDLEGGRLLAVGEGQLSADSREAVNGAQLFATNTKVAEQGAQIASAREDLDALRVDFDNYTPDLGSVVQFGDDGTVDLKAARLVALADGEIAAGSREAVTGGQLFVTNERVSVLEEAQKYVVVGYDEWSMPAEAGLLATAMGSDTKALAEGATAIGSFAQARGKNSVSLGRAAVVHVGAEDGFALGARSQVHIRNGVALGGASQVLPEAENSVALGHSSLASGAYEVSLGHINLKRRVTNAANGVQGHDLTTVDQLSGVVNALGGGAGFAVDGSVIAPSYGVQGAVHRTVADALAALDAGVDSNRGGLDAMDARLDTLDQARAMADASAVRFGADRSAVDFGGARLINVGEGDISHAGSREVVTGGQLHASNQRIAGLEEKHLYAVVGYDELSKPAEAALLGTAMGSDARALAEGATAIGSYALAGGKNSVSLGRAAYVHEGAEDGFALGARSQVQASYGVALGGGSQVRHGATYSIALGYDSYAYGPNEVSLGNTELKRRVTNAANGRDASDLTTVSQLRSAFAALGGDMRMDADGNIIAPEFHVQGQRQATVGDALKSLDGAVVDTRRDLASIDARFERLFDDGGLRSDGTGQLRLAGEHGRVLGNVANGMIAPGSRDAVNGGQLHAVQQQLNGRIDGLQSQIDGSATASRQAAVDEVAGESPADSQTPASPVKDAPSVASTDTPKPKPEADDPLPQVDTRAVDQAVNQAQAYTDQAMASVDRRLDRMDKRLNRMAAMGSAQAAMAMNTAGLQTYNRLGAGVGHAEGESALAVGYQRVLNERGSATFSLNGAFTNSGERTVGVGFGVGW